MDRTKIGIFKKAYHVSFTCFLDSKDGLALESEITLVLGSDFPDKSLEWELADQELCGFLELTDFTESDSTRSETVGLFDTFIGDVGGFASGLLG